MTTCQHQQLKRELSQWIDHARQAGEPLQNVRLCVACDHYVSLQGDGRGGLVEQVWASPAFQRWKALQESLLADEPASTEEEADIFKLNIKRIRRNRNDELYQRLPKLRDVLFDSLFD
jgi:hypothetical protein